MFVYTGRLADPGVVPPEGGWLTDDDVRIEVARRPFAAPDDALPLYPEGLADLL